MHIIIVIYRLTRAYFCTVAIGFSETRLTGPEIVFIPPIQMYNLTEQLRLHGSTLAECIGTQFVPIPPATVPDGKQTFNYNMKCGGGIA